MIDNLNSYSIVENSSDTALSLLQDQCFGQCQHYASAGLQLEQENTYGERIKYPVFTHVKNDIRASTIESVMCALVLLLPNVGL
jgi:hypothetical protein